jgi:hypothetical protein
LGRQGQAEQQLYRLVDGGKSGAEKTGADARKQRAKPEAMVEQPERLVRLAAAEMARQGERKNQAPDQQPSVQPDGGIEPEQQTQHRDAE